MSTLACGLQGWESQRRGPGGACLCADHCHRRLGSVGDGCVPADPPAPQLALRVLVLWAEFRPRLLPPPPLGSLAPVSGGSVLSEPHPVWPLPSPDTDLCGVDSTLSPGPTPSSVCWREVSGARPAISPRLGGSRAAVESVDVSGSDFRAFKRLILV